MFQDLSRKLENGHLLGNQHVAIIDCETTGFDPIGCDPIVLSIIIADHNLNELSKKTFKARPFSKKYWGKGAEEIHGIPWKEAEYFPTQRETCMQILNFLVPYKHSENKPILFVSHDKNNFDWKFTEWLFRKQDLQYSFWKVFHHGYKISTIQFADVMGYTGNGLAEWARRLDVKLKHHDAESDARASYEVLKYLCQLSHKQTPSPGPIITAAIATLRSQLEVT